MSVSFSFSSLFFIDIFFFCFSTGLFLPWKPKLYLFVSLKNESNHFLRNLGTVGIWIPNFFIIKMVNTCNGIDNGNEQDLCMPSLFSIFMVDKVQYFDLEFSFNQSCFRIKRLKRVRVKMFIWTFGCQKDGFWIVSKIWTLCPKLKTF